MDNLLSLGGDGTLARLRYSRARNKTINTTEKREQGPIDLGFIGSRVCCYLAYLKVFGYGSQPNITPP